MTPSSLPGLSAKARALLAAEREIAPAPPGLRWRAQLRARHAFEQGRAPRAPRPGLGSVWRRMRVPLAAALVATSAFATWQQLAPEPLDAPPAIAIGTSPRPTPARAPRSTPATATAKAAPGAIAGAGEAPTPAPAPRTEPAASKVAPTVPPRTESAPKRATPADELAMLDGARRAVMTRNFARALRVLERHARSFPNSALGEEREALRIKALQGSGKATQANDAAREFESRYPRSVLATELNKGD